MWSDISVIGCRAPRGQAVGRQSDVDGLLDQHPLLVLDLEHRLALGQRLVDGGPCLADALAGLLASLRRERTDLPVGQGQWRTVAGVSDPHPFERVEVGGLGDGRKCRVTRGLDRLGLQVGDLHGVEVGIWSGHETQV